MTKKYPDLPGIIIVIEIIGFFYCSLLKNGESSLFMRLNPNNV